MATYLLSWNPDRWPWERCAQQASAVAAGETVRMPWSTGTRKDIAAGSRIFIIRQGVEPRGIVASGDAVGPVYEQPHIDPEEAGRAGAVLSTPIEFDQIIDASKKAPLARAALNEGKLAEFRWDIQAEGVRIPDDIASALETAWAAHCGGEPQGKFVVGARYSRFEVLARLGLPVRKGGDPFTGYFRNGDDFFLFPNIGTAGATGHDYDNGWEGDVLRWYAKTGTTLQSPSVQRMLADGARIHVFTREHQRDPFRYEGLAHSASVSDESPVLIRWSFEARAAAVAISVSHLDQTLLFTEGARRQSLVTRPERDPNARAACIRHHGASCCVCGFDFGLRYGTLGSGFIHVHHLDPLGQAEAERQVDPVRDLRPVCPNCHAMLHRRDPPIAIEELAEVIRVADTPPD